MMLDDFLLGIWAKNFYTNPDTFVRWDSNLYPTVKDASWILVVTFKCIDVST